MRNVLFILGFVLFTFAASAQYIYNDFDGNQNEPFSGWPNMPSIIANPDQSGINTSANVGEWIRSQEQWAHIYTNLEGKVDFSTGEVFTLKIWSPIICDVLFKLEDQNNGGVFVEVLQSVANPNQWVELSFNFAGAPSGTFDKIVIFMDFSSNADNTFYFDDIVGPEYVGGPGPDPINLPVTFDDDELEYGLIDFGGNLSEIIVDPTNADNKVVKTIKTAGAELWAGTTVGGTVGFATPIPFEEGSTTMTVDVWSPFAGIPVRLKVEDAGDPTITVETETLTTVAEDWETISFDFSNEAPGTAELNFDYDYNKASIFFDFGTPGASDQTYYWDNMDFDGELPPVKPLLAADVQDNFEGDGWGTIPEWKFQDPDLVELPIIVDPLNPANHAADYIRSGTFEYTNAQFILNHRMDLTERNVFEMNVFFPSSNDYSGSLTPTAAIKLQNSLLGGNAWTTQTEIINTVSVFDEWVTLEFDFSAVSDRDDYDQVVVQFGGEGHFVPGQFHFDHLILLNPVGINTYAVSNLNISPNPANDFVSITGFQKLSSLAVYNMNGQKVMTFDVVPQQISIANLPKGVYTMMAKGYNGDIFNSKLIVR
jgi:hypothetical protein